MIYLVVQYLMPRDSQSLLFCNETLSGCLVNVTVLVKDIPTAGGEPVPSHKRIVWTLKQRFPLEWYQLDLIVGAILFVYFRGNQTSFTEAEHFFNASLQTYS